MAKKTAVTTKAQEPVVAAPVAQPETPAPAISAKPQGHPGVFVYFSGLVIAAIAALVLPDPLRYYVYIVLAILGFIVGLSNITENEVLLFLVATVAFVVSANSVKTVLAVPAVSQLLNNVIIFTAAAAFIVSMRAIIKVSKSN